MRKSWYLISIPLAYIGKAICWRSMYGSYRWRLGVWLFFWAIIMSSWSVENK